MWIVIALLCALFAAFSDVYSKKVMGKDLDREDTLLSRYFYTVPFLWIFVLINGVPIFETDMFLYYFLSVPIEVAAGIMFIYALNSSPISLVIPLFSFTPVFVLLVSIFTLHEYPNIYGVIGVLLIVAGSYAVNISNISRGVFSPLTMLFKDKGSRFMLGAAFLYGMTSVIAKKCILKSDPYFYAATFYSAVLIVLLIKAKLNGKRLLLFKKEFVINGLIFGTMVLFHVIGLKLTYAGYLVSIKRSSILFSIVLGMILFKERDIAQKLFGALMMIGGILFITFQG